MIESVGISGLPDISLDRNDCINTTPFSLIQLYRAPNGSEGRVPLLVASLVELMSSLDHIVLLASARPHLVEGPLDSPQIAR